MKSSILYISFIIILLMGCGEADFDARANDNIQGTWEAKSIKLERYNSPELISEVGSSNYLKFEKRGRYTGDLDWKISLDTSFYEVSGTYYIYDHALILEVNDTIEFGLGGVPFDELQISPPYNSNDLHYFIVAERK